MSNATVSTQVPAQVATQEVAAQEVAQYVPLFAAVSALVKKGEQRRMDERFVKRLSITEFSLEISEHGNIIGVLRIPPVHTLNDDGIFYNVIAQRFRNAGIRTHKFNIDQSGWGQINLLIKNAADALFLVETCKERSFPNTANYKLVESMVNNRSKVLLTFMLDGKFAATEADMPEDLRVQESVQTESTQEETVPVGMYQLPALSADELKQLAARVAAEIAAQQSAKRSRRSRKNVGQDAAVQ